MLWTHPNTTSRGHVRSHSFAQLGIALRRSVVRPTPVERSLGGFHNVGRCWKIRLADLEMNHVPPGRFQSAGAHQYLKGGFDQNPVHPLRQLHSLFLKNGTPSRVSTRATRSSMETRAPSIRPVTR